LFWLVMFRALVVAIASIVVAFASAAQVDSSALFADGERAFAAGNYQEALRLFAAAREAGATGPSSYYNIGVCQYRLRDYAAAEATFALLATEFPAMRELAEYNRGLALRADGRYADARVAFERARLSTDDKIVALANAQLAERGATRVVDEPRWLGYFAGGLGHDDNVALLNELVLTSTEASSPLAEVLGVLTRDVGQKLRFDFSGYAVHYPDVGNFDQTALRLSLAAEQPLGRWTLLVGPTLGRSTFDGDGFEELFGADLRLRRSFGAAFVFEARAVYDDVAAADSRFGYLNGSRRLMRLSVQHTGAGRIRAGYDAEREDRADPGVSPSRERFGVVYQRRFSERWNADAAIAYRTSRYDAASVPREEQLLELTFAARRVLKSNWTLGVEYQWFDNDSTVEDFAYDGQRFALGFSRSFYGP
jgi:tetratricopeptide (TPR) repeat protein